MTGSKTRGVERLAAAALVAAAVAAAGCGGGVRPAAAPAGREAVRTPAAHAPDDTPVGFRLHRSAEGGVSLALPLGWLALAGPDARYPGVIQTLTGTHRAFLPYLLALASPGSPLKLFGWDTASSRARPSTVSVQLVLSTAPGPYSRWARKALRSLAAAKTLRGRLDARRADLPAGPALRVEFARSDGDRVLLYVVSAGGGLWAVAFAAPPGAAGRDSWDRAAATLALTRPVGGPRIAGGTQITE
ncbi:MAG TPA: hypothetical protein VFJ77_05735 [Gaiellaceae bacterium]|nr:hypothetical protein [Gaiellaceae bacterium]